MSVNRCHIVGHLGQDPEVRFTSGGNAVCNLSVATNEQWTDANGEKKEHVEWFRVQVWGKTAEACGKFLAKGRQVYVEGKLRTRKWQDKNGADRWTTELIADRVEFLGGKGEAAPSQRQPTPSAPENSDIPF